MHARTSLLALAFCLASCSAEPAGSELAPVQGGLTAKPKPLPKPVEPVEPDVKVATGTPCTAMTDSQLDFTIDTDGGAIVSLEAGARIDASSETTTVTLYATNTASEKNGLVVISVRVTGAGSAAIVDAAGNSTSLASGTTLHTVSVPANTTFTLTVTARNSTGTQSEEPALAEKAAIPKLPVTTKKAIIKPVPQCPG